jgi:phosphoglycolate phosphatase|tara:strand:+ start:2298 stop:2936 length:639 start_codon:yes stop_codon:yes gene_type:complete
MKYKHIIWDWNGTLLDDTWLCVEGINKSLEKRSLQTITKEIYRKVFSFPVEDYYERLGFDFNKEPFEVAGDEFVAYYAKCFHKVKLHKQVSSALGALEIAGFSQSILSAGKQEYLDQWVKVHGLSEYFMIIRGIDNQYARGKIELGISFIKELPYEKDEIVMVGDTVHDSDVADAMGIDCLLIDHGHMGNKKLKTTGRKVFSNIEHVRDHLT